MKTAPHPMPRPEPSCWFVVRWASYGYVTKRQPDRKPYAAIATDPDTQRWASREAAERFLKLKDPQWAASCTIEAVPVTENSP